MQHSLPHTEDHPIASLGAILHVFSDRSLYAAGTNNQWDMIGIGYSIFGWHNPRVQLGIIIDYGIRMLVT